MKKKMTLTERLEIRTINVYYHHYTNIDVVCITRITKGGHISRDIVRSDNSVYHDFMSKLAQIPPQVELKFHHIFHCEEFLG